MEGNKILKVICQNLLFLSGWMDDLTLKFRNDHLTFSLGGGGDFMWFSLKPEKKISTQNENQIIFFLNLKKFLVENCRVRLYLHLKKTQTSKSNINW